MANAGRKYILLVRNWMRRKSNQFSGKRLDIRIVEKIPSMHDYNQLRESVGWQVIEPEVTPNPLSKSIYCVCAYQGENIIGMGRIVGDGTLIFYIQDVIVDSKFQGLGVGTKIMEKLMEYLKRNSNVHSGIGLMSAKGREKFYAKFGFVSRPNRHMGAGMTYLNKGENNEKH
jgi:ribosomal protein S18 acetylase RimI-like enzyme